MFVVGYTVFMLSDHLPSHQINYNDFYFPVSSLGNVEMSQDFYKKFDIFMKQNVGLVTNFLSCSMARKFL